MRRPGVDLRDILREAARTGEELLAPLDLAEVPALGDEARDVDGWADLRDLRRT